jgi:hypothetical protein
MDTQLQPWSSNIMTEISNPRERVNLYVRVRPAMIKMNPTLQEASDINGEQSGSTVSYLYIIVGRRRSDGVQRYSDENGSV